MKLPLIVSAILLAIIIASKWYNKRPEKTEVKTEKKKTSWGWIVCVLILVFGGYYGYKYYLKSPTAKEAVVAREWILYWDKTPEAIGFTPAVRSKSNRVKIEKMNDNILVFRQFYKHKGIAQQALFVGKKTAPLVYNGRWQQDVPAGSGDFFVRFTPDMKAASGWQDNGTKRAIPMQLFAK
ncbi:hypothetical protein KJ934_02615 [Patescibacteria group bacterium]|nr:hypothetical protein [Patescibacteria group bacterium]MBU4353181.1 hypothetical protein [Patescibacteria group bacterium]MBU4477366.1 hypothetical protein [Patescibacteria group bacterium]MCG2699256.1 hypothetical protein [Candidatus Parcubacteria bacterium]